MTGEPAVQLAPQVRPYGERCTCVDTPVDEEQTSSGIVLPIHERDGAKRGVVTAIGWLDTDLQVGTVVWYRGGVKIGDVTVVDRDAIIAYAGDDHGF